MSIGERITKLRKDAKLSQGQLADLLGITRQAVSKWENDLSSPDTLKLIQLSDVLNTDVEYLATGKYPEREPAPIIVNLVKSPEPLREKIVEKVYEKPIVETKIKRVIRVKYKRNPIEYAIISIVSLAVGLLLGALIF